MDAQGVLQTTFDLSDMVAMSYLGDLDDNQLMRRPHPDCNHIKWQIGHLVAAENNVVEAAFPGTMPPLPAGFAARYDKANAGNNDPAAFDSKEELLRLFQQQRAATLAKLKSLSAADLDQPAPERMRSYAPTIGALFGLLGQHWMMHAGQWVVVRRELGKPAQF